MRLLLPEIEHLEIVECTTFSVINRKNAGDADYRPMAPGFDGIAYQAALALVLEGRDEPNGYTERVLTSNRRRVKQEL